MDTGVTVERHPTAPTIGSQYVIEEYTIPPVLLHQIPSGSLEIARPPSSKRTLSTQSDIVKRMELLKLSDLALSLNESSSTIRTKEEASFQSLRDEYLRRFNEQEESERKEHEAHRNAIRNKRNMLLETRDASGTIINTRENLEAVFDEEKYLRAKVERLKRKKLDYEILLKKIYFERKLMRNEACCTKKKV